MSNDAPERLRSCVTLGDVEWAVRHIDTAQARIAELEAALGGIKALGLDDGRDHTQALWAAIDAASRALEAKP